jgi:neurofibromin 1
LDPSEDIEENRRNLVALTQKVFDAIVSSADKYDILLHNFLELNAG